MSLPKRILILGPSGAGKSTLARSIGDRLGLPVVHLGAINWNPGWVQTETGLFRERVKEAVARDAWVMDGNYSAHLDLRLPRAEAVIWLDLPRYVYFSRAVWRSIWRFGRERDDLGPGCPEPFDLSFLLDWVWNYPTRSRASRTAHVRSSFGSPRNNFAVPARSEAIHAGSAALSRLRHRGRVDPKRLTRNRHRPN